MENECERIIKKAILGRLLVLLLMLAEGSVKTPEEWLFVQLSSEIMASLAEVDDYLKNRDYELINTCLNGALNYFRKKYSQRFILFIDETNILLDKCVGKFTAPSMRQRSESTGEPPLKASKLEEEVSSVYTKRSLFSFLLDNLISLNDAAVLSAGTSIKMKDEQRYLSAVGKTDVDAGRKLQKITEFHFLEPAQVKKVFQRFFSKEFLSSKIKWEALYNLLKGRLCFTMFLIHKIATFENTSLNQSDIDTWIDDLSRKE